jgi:nicotinamidase-related amidase
MIAMRNHNITAILVLLATLATSDVAAQQQDFPITIDATALSSVEWYLNNGYAGRGSNAAAKTFRLIPGGYNFCTTYSDCFSFTVTASGAVEYDSAFDAFLSGRGTNFLTVAGFAITVDATALSHIEWSLEKGYVGMGSNAAAKTFRMIPGGYNFCTTYFDCFSLTVTASGAVEYDPAFDTFLSGRGTNFLTVAGFAITVDATALSHIEWSLEKGYVGMGSNAAAKTFRLIPGEYNFCTTYSDCFSFIVTASGAVEYDPAFDTFLSGRGTNFLTVAGFAITVDTRVLASAKWSLESDYAGGGSNAAAKTFRLIPGVYNFCAVYSDCFSFTVTVSGTVEYDSVISTFVWGEGGPLLIVVGFPVIIDATKLGSGEWTLEGAYAGVYANTKAKTVRLLPGSYRFCTDSFSRCFQFEVGNAGSVTHSPNACVSTVGANRLNVSCKP